MSWIIESDGVGSHVEGDFRKGHEQSIGPKASEVDIKSVRRDFVCSFVLCNLQNHLVVPIFDRQDVRRLRSSPFCLCSGLCRPNSVRAEETGSFRDHGTSPMEHWGRHDMADSLQLQRLRKVPTQQRSGRGC